MLTEEHKRITDMLVPALARLAQKHHGLVPPDEKTLQILRCCVGSAFTLGTVYGQLSEKIPWRERLHEAFEILGGRL